MTTHPKQIIEGISSLKLASRDQKRQTEASSQGLQERD